MAETSFKASNTPSPILADDPKVTKKASTAQVTWLGDGSDTETNEWNGQTFKKGEAVEVKNEGMINKAKGNRFFKVEGDDSETVEDNPEPQVLAGRIDDQVENAAFAPQEVLTARRQESLDKQQEDAEREEEVNPKEKGGSRTFAERVPPKKGPLATPD